MSLLFLQIKLKSNWYKRNTNHHSPQIYAYIFPCYSGLCQNRSSCSLLACGGLQAALLCSLHHLCQTHQAVPGGRHGTLSCPGQGWQSGTLAHPELLSVKPDEEKIEINTVIETGKHFYQQTSLH